MSETTKPSWNDDEEKLFQTTVDEVAEFMQEKEDAKDFIREFNTYEAQQLVGIFEKHTFTQKDNTELSIEELEWLYDMRTGLRPLYPEQFKQSGELHLIKNIITRDRDLISDLNVLFSNHEVYKGNLDLSVKTAEGLNLPNEIQGDLEMSFLTSAEGLNLPNEIQGDLYLNSLTNAEGLKIPNKIGGTLELGVTTAEGLNLPDEIDYNLYLEELNTTEGLKLPNKIDGTLWLHKLASAEGLKLPEMISGDLVLSGLKTSNGLELPSVVGGKVIFHNNLPEDEFDRLKQSYPHLVFENYK